MAAAIPIARLDVCGGRHAVERRELRDEQRLADAAADHRLRLVDVDAAAVDAASGRASAHRDLAAGERDVHGRVQALVAEIAVPLVHRLLEAEEPQVLERAARLDRIPERVGGVAVGHRSTVGGRSRRTIS